MKDNTNDSASKAQEEDNRLKYESKCVVCRWGDQKQMGILVKPCHCTRGYRFYHYKCLGEFIIKTLDKPCKGCEHRFKDSRIVRNPDYWHRFIQQSLTARLISILLTILWSVYLLILSYWYYWSCQPLCLVHNRAQPIKVSTFTALFVVLNVLLVYYISSEFNHWSSRQDETIHFLKWDQTDQTLVFNLSKARRNYTKDHFAGKTVNGSKYTSIDSSKSVSGRTNSTRGSAVVGNSGAVAGNVGHK